MKVSLEDVEVRRGGKSLLANLNFALEPGECVAVLGPNGAGKSTLLAVLGGDVVPDRGTVRLDDRPMGEWELSEIARRRSVLLQHSSLDFPFTVGEVVRLGRLPHGDADAPSGRAAVKRALERFDLGSLIDRKYPTLSGGERQRTQAARVFAQIDGVEHRRAGLLLDEPTSALDLVHQHRLLSAVRSHTERGCSALVALHDPNLAGAYADRIVLLNHGRIAAAGRPEVVLRPELLTPVYETPIEVLSLEQFEHPVVISRPHEDALVSRPHEDALVSRPHEDALVSRASDSVSAARRAPGRARSGEQDEGEQKDKLRGKH